jgi:hypothetical protein
LTQDNIRFWSIIAVVALIYSTLAINSVDWATNLSSEKIVREIKREYQAFLLDLEVEYVTIDANLTNRTDPWSQSKLGYLQDIVMPRVERELGAALNIGKSSGLSGDIFGNLEIEAIASAVRSVPGYSRIGRYRPRQERYLSLEKKVPVYRSHEDRINIPIPETISFASNNGIRDINETSAIMELNELDIKYCFESMARFDPSFSGSILVSFTIHPDGYVIPASIKIIKSNINDPRILQCIERSIRRWRNFTPIAYEDGNFTVTRKYIF